MAMTIQHGTPSSGTGSVVLTIADVPEGAMIFAQLAQYTAGVRTYTATANNGIGALTEAVYATHGVNTNQGIWYKHNVAAGTHQITLQANTGTILIHGIAGYVTGLDSAASPITSFFIDAANGTDHFCGAVGEVDTTTPAAIIGGGLLTASVTTTVAGTNYTKVDSAGSEVRVLYQYYLATEAVTADRGAWSSTGTARTGRGVMAAFPELAEVPSSTPAVYPRITRRRLPGGLL